MQTCLCAQCGAQFLKSGRRIVCSDSCARERNRERNLSAYHARRALGTDLRTGYSGACTRCGVVFEGNKRSQRFCSRDCHYASRRRKKTKKSAFRRRAEKLADRAAAGSNGGGTVWVQGSCGVCCSQFLGRGVSARYCSQRCSKLAKWNRGDWKDAKVRVEIYKRDGWTCQLCLGPVELASHHLSDLYPSLDHIVPRSMGGGHEPGNLQTAHRICNSRRRDLPVDEYRALALTA